MRQGCPRSSVCPSSPTEPQGSVLWFGPGNKGPWGLSIARRMGRKRQNSWVGVRTVSQTAKEVNSNNNNTDKNMGIHTATLSLPDAQCTPQPRLISSQPAPQLLTKHDIRWYRIPHLFGQFGSAVRLCLLLASCWKLTQDTGPPSLKCHTGVPAVSPCWFWGCDNDAMK